MECMEWMEWNGKSGEGKVFSVGGVGNNFTRNKVAAISGMLALGQALPGLGHLTG